MALSTASTKRHLHKHPGRGGLFRSKPSVPHTTATRQSPVRYAAIYARVSTEDQGKGYSIPTQIEACQRLAQQEGYAVPESHIFIDEGLSGTTLVPHQSSIDG